jgi:HAD superfamily 5'-nucleotidase-like hydrolase
MGTSDSIQELLPIADLALPLEGQPPKTRRIYCNRDLRLDRIDAIGFDMDYTLAIYRQEAIDRLSVEATAKKLVARGYPETLFEMSYRTHFPIRGLLVDVKLGNILKTDRYRYAKTAYHGTRELGSDERKRLYQGKRIRPGMARYYSVDTLYALSEVTVFAAAVDALDRQVEARASSQPPARRGRSSRPPAHSSQPPAALTEAGVDYATLFRDVRECIDEAHRDGTIKNIIVSDLPRYIERDLALPDTLHKLRSAGKKLFLLTNSEPPYTEKVMRYLLDGGLPEYRTWHSYFDAVIAEAGKPRFFTEQRAFEEALEGAVAPEGVASEVEEHGITELTRGRVYRLGSLSEFERLFGIEGDHILYVGDHIYGDVLRAKKESSWRTLMIIQEMTDELDALERFAPEIERMHLLEARHYELLDALRDRQGLLKRLARRADEDGVSSAERVEIDAAHVRVRRAVEKARTQIKAVDEELHELEHRLDRAYHPFWGSAFKAESELSSFGEQVERYACLYTDRVTNLLGYSASHFFRGPRHHMAHERG